MRYWTLIATFLAGCAVGRIAALNGYGGDAETAITWTIIGATIAALAAYAAHRNQEP